MWHAEVFGHAALSGTLRSAIGRPLGDGQGHDDDQQDVILDGVDVPIDTYPNPPPGTAAERFRGRPGWRVLGEKRDDAADAVALRGIEFAQLTQRCRTDFDPVGHAQPRSTRTCSQGMLGSASAMAISNAATSSACSTASSISSYCAGVFASSVSLPHTGV